MVKENEELMYGCLWSVSHCQDSSGYFSLWLSHHTGHLSGSTASPTSPHLTMRANQCHLKSFGPFLFVLSASLSSSNSLSVSPTLMFVEEIAAMSSLAVVSFSPQALRLFFYQVTLRNPCVSPCLWA